MERSERRIAFSFLLTNDQEMTIAVAGDGLIDDIDGGMMFYPSLGVCDGAMVYSVWPFELKEYIQEKKAKREKPVSDRLIALAVPG